MTRSLATLNSTLTRRISPHRLGFLAFLLTVVTFLSYYQIWFGLNVSPSPSGDESAYDSIGWELARGNGFQRDFGNSEFRAAYHLTDENTRFLQPSVDDRIPDTTRPPLFPFVLSLLDRSLGRQFWAVRVWNVICLATVCGFVSHFVAKRYGTLPALFAIPLFLFLDVRTRLHGRAILTEATATLLLTFLCLSLLKVAENSDRTLSSRIRWFFAACLWLTLGLYARTNLLILVPVLALFLALVAYRASRTHNFLNAIVTAVIFVNVIVVGYLPWVVRNLSVTGEFLPMGTQGATQLSAAYGDAIWNTRGIWPNLESSGFFDDLDVEGLSPMQTRIAKARYSEQAARAWIASHPGKALLLFPLKISQAFRPHSILEGMILMLSIIGLYVLGQGAEQSVFVTLIAGCAVGIGLTWSVEGRFLVPLLFVWQTSAGVGLWWIVCRVTGLDRENFEVQQVSTTDPS